MLGFSEVKMAKMGLQYEKLIGYLRRYNLGILELMNLVNDIMTSLMHEKQSTHHTVIPLNTYRAFITRNNYPSISMFCR